MSGETAPVLRHIELPPCPGTRVTLFLPAGNEMVTDPGPLLNGAGFTLDFARYGIWRSVLRSAKWDISGVVVELEVEGRYPETGGG